MSRVCILCQHFQMTTAEPGYSSWTPGSDMSIYCAKGHWQVDNYETTQGVFRDMLKQAETCPDFIKAKP